MALEIFENYPDNKIKITTMSNFSLTYRHLIWDWNGTLLNDVDDCLAVLNDMLKKRCLTPLSYQQYRDLFNFPVLDFYQQIGFDFAAESFDDVACEYHAGYARRLPECRLHTGAQQILRAAAGAGYNQSLLSAYPQNALENAIKYFQVGSWFTKVIGLDDHFAHSKLDNGKRFIKELNIDPGQILLIGDTLHDFEVADAVGIDCTLLTNGHQPRRRLQSCGAILFDSLSDLQKNLINSTADLEPHN